MGSNLGFRCLHEKDLWVAWCFGPAEWHARFASQPDGARHDGGGDKCVVGIGPYRLSYQDVWAKHGMFSVLATSCILPLLCLLSRNATCDVPFGQRTLLCKRRLRQHWRIADQHWAFCLPRVPISIHTTEGASTAFSEASNYGWQCVKGEAVKRHNSWLDTGLQSPPCILVVHYCSKTLWLPSTAFNSEMGRWMTLVVTWLLCLDSLPMQFFNLTASKAF